MIVKYCTALLVALMGLGCALMPSTSKVAKSGSNARSIALNIELRDATQQKFGQLQLSGKTLNAGQASPITIKFTASRALSTYEAEASGSVNGNLSGSVNGNDDKYQTTMYPQLKLSFDDSVDKTTCYDCKTVSNLVSYVSNDGKHLQLNDMQPGDSITLRLMVVASDNFMLTASLTGKDIEAEGKGEVDVQPAPPQSGEKKKKKTVLPQAKTPLQQALDACGRNYTVSSSGDVKLKPWSTMDSAEYYEDNSNLGLLLVDRDHMMVDEEASLRVTYIATQDNAFGGSPLSADSSYIAIELPQLYIVDSQFDFRTHSGAPDTGYYEQNSVYGFLGRLLPTGRKTGYEMAVIRPLKKHECFTLNFKVTPLTNQIHRSPNIPLTLTLKKGGQRTARTIEIPIAPNPKIPLILTWDHHFRVKFKRMYDDQRLDVVFTALRHVQGATFSNPKVEIDFKAPYFTRFNNRHGNNAKEFVRKAKKIKGTYKYEFNVSEDMVTGNSFTLLFDFYPYAPPNHTGQRTISIKYKEAGKNRWNTAQGVMQW